MGIKVIPLFKEVYDEYIRDSQDELNPPDEAQCRTLLFPSRLWRAAFKEENKYRLDPHGLKKELKRIHKKSAHFESHCRAHGLNLTMVYLAAQKCNSLFLQTDGEFFWFFKKMKLIHREKSFLFTHAGLDNHISKIIKNSGIKKTNFFYKKLRKRRFRNAYYNRRKNCIRRNDLRSFLTSLCLWYS